MSEKKVRVGGDTHDQVDIPTPNEPAVDEGNSPSSATPESCVQADAKEYDGEKKRYVRVSPIGLSKGVICKTENLEWVLERMEKVVEIGGGYELKAVEMAEQEFQDLDEFRGF